MKSGTKTPVRWTAIGWAVIVLLSALACGDEPDQEGEFDHIALTSQRIINSDLNLDYGQLMTLLRQNVANDHWLPVCSSTLVRNSSKEGTKAWLLTASHCMADSMAVLGHEVHDGTALVTDLADLSQIGAPTTFELTLDYVDSHPDDFFASDCIRRAYIPIPSQDQGYPVGYRVDGVSKDFALVRVDTNFGGLQQVDLGAPGSLPDGPITVTAMGFGHDEGCMSRGDHIAMRQARSTTITATGSPEWSFDFAGNGDEVVGGGDSGGPVLYDNRLYGVHHWCDPSLNINESSRTDHNESNWADGEDGPYDWIQNRLVDHDGSRDCVAYPGGGYRWQETVRDGCDENGDNCCPAYTVWGDACTVTDGDPDGADVGDVTDPNDQTAGSDGGCSLRTGAQPTDSTLALLLLLVPVFLLQHRRSVRPNRVFIIHVGEGCDLGGDLINKLPATMYDYGALWWWRRRESNPST